MKGVDLDAIIRNAGMTQKEMAGLVGMSPQNLSSHLRSDDLRSSLVEKVAVVLNKSIGELYGDVAYNNDGYKSVVQQIDQNRLLALMAEKDKQIAICQQQITELIQALTKR